MKSFINIMALIVALLAIINISNFEIELGEFYYYSMAFTLTVLMILSKNVKINYLILWIIGAALISIIFNQIPSVFIPYARLMAFILIVSLVGPFIYSNTINYFRLKLFNAINIFIIYLIIASFLGLLVNSSIVFGRGGFTGFFNHSMILGPMAAIAMINSIEKAYSNKNKLFRLIYAILSFISFITCVAAGSRVALIAGLAGTLFFIYKVNQKKLTYLLKFVLILGSILILSYPIWEEYTERIISKMSYAVEMGDITVTRTHLWVLRLEEFSSSPFLGIGFASINTKIFNNQFDPYKGRIEPGTSWLAVLSMIGLLGFIPFILLLAGYMKFILKDNKTILQTAYLGSLLILFFVHMIAEGYVFSAGSGLFFYFWLLLGVLSRIKINNDNIIIK